MRQLLLCGAAIATLLVSACNGGGATGDLGVVLTAALLV